MEVTDYKSPMQEAIELLKPKAPISLRLEGDGFLHECDFPSSVEQLKIEQFEMLAQFLFMPDLLKPLYRYELLRRLLKLSKKDFMMLHVADIKDLLELVEPLLKKPISHQSFYDTVAIKGIAFDGLRSQFLHMILDEYIYADSLFLNYIGSKNMNTLDKLVALLLRPKDLAYQHAMQERGFIQYEEREDEYIEIVKRCFAEKPKTKKRDLLNTSNLAKKHGIVLNFFAQRNFVASRYRKTFGNTGSGSNAKQDWRKTTVTLAGTELGNVDMVRRSLAHDVFTLMESQLERVKKD